MLLLKLLQQLILLLLFARRLAHLLLPLIVHHLLHHAARLAVQITQLAVLGRDLARVDLGCRGDNVSPPLHLVGLVEVNIEFFAGRSGLERPGRVVDDDGVRKGSLRRISGVLRYESDSSDSLLRSAPDP